MAILSGNIEHFTFAIDGLDEPLKVVRFTGLEQLSAPFQFDIEIASADPELNLDQLVGKAGRLTLYSRHDHIERYVHGIINQIERAAPGRRLTTYPLRLVPALELLNYRQDCRIFQNQSVPDIVQQVLDKAGLPADQYKFELQGGYAPREYCVQYRETDFAFISRLLEEEGIFYYFQHSVNTHVLTLSDHSAAHSPIAEPSTLLYHDRTGTLPAHDSITSFDYSEQVQPGKVMLRDYNFKKPSLNLTSQSQFEKDLPLEIYDYPGRYEGADQGSQYANLKLQAWQVARQSARGRSDCLRLLPGFAITLDHHPATALNQGYLLTKVKSQGHQPQVLEEGASGEGSRYENTFRCIAATVPFRPRPKTPKPQIFGIQTAMVVGPSGEEIYTDEYGRVKVQFHWDRQGQYDEHSSCWVRVSQAWTGAGWGALYIPRIGQEVVINFIDGDPDRPIVKGALYHGTHRAPYPLPQHKTQSAIKTNSSKGGNGFNEIRLEDEKGEEQLFVHAEKDQDIRIKHDAKAWIGNDRHLIVQQSQFERVENDKHQTVHGDHNQKIEGTLSIDVGADLQHKTAQNHAHEALTMHLSSGQKIVLEAGAELTLKVGGNFVKLDASGVMVVGGTIKINEGGAAGAGEGVSLKTVIDALEAVNSKPGTVETVPDAASTSPRALDLPKSNFQRPEIRKMTSEELAAARQTVARNAAPGAIAAAALQPRYTLCVVLAYKDPHSLTRQAKPTRLKLENELTGPEARASAKIKPTDSGYTEIRQLQMPAGEYTLAFAKTSMDAARLKDKKK